MKHKFLILFSVILFVLTYAQGMELFLEDYEAELQFTPPPSPGGERQSFRQQQFGGEQIGGGPQEYGEGNQQQRGYRGGRFPRFRVGERFGQGPTSPTMQTDTSSTQRACVPQGTEVALDQHIVEASFGITTNFTFLTYLSNLDFSGVNHVEINWLPTGHPPGGYQVPHWDVEFNLISPIAKASIDCSNAPQSPTNYAVPAGYSISQCLPKVGYLAGNTSLAQNLDVLQKDLGFAYWGRLTTIAVMATPSYLMSLTRDSNGTVVTDNVRKTFSMPPMANEVSVRFIPTQYEIWYLPSCQRFFIGLTGWVPSGRMGLYGR